MAGSTPADHRSTADSLVYSDTDESLAKLRLTLSTFADLHEFPLSDVEVKNKIDEMRDWVEKQKKSSDEKAKKELVQNMGKVATSTVNGIQKIKGGDALGGTLEMVSGYLVFAGEMVGGPIGAAVGAITGTICSIIGAIFAASKPHQPSFIEQVAEVVHKELVQFNSKLQDQKYDGLKRRVSDQSAQLQKMKLGDELDDPNLWNDYVQFMGELGNRIQSPLPYKYSDNLTNDTDVADFVRALMTYCKAFSCFNSLLLIAKGTFADLGSEHKEDDEKADRKIDGQKQDLEKKLSFLFGEKYLTFLGRLPSEEGKLTKLVAFSRNAEARLIVKMTTRGFGFPEILDYEAVEKKAEIVSRQSVKLKLENHPIVFPIRSINRRRSVMQFINETQYPMKVIGGTYPESVKQKFTRVLQPRSSSIWRPNASFGGYVLIYLDGKLRPDDEPDSADKTRVIEFAYKCLGVYIQDKTCSEFTRGRDTYDKVERRKGPENVYWKTNEVHHMASAIRQTKIVGRRTIIYRWRLVFQDFDPSIDIVTQAPNG